jgi:hypothetical protein
MSEPQQICADGDRSRWTTVHGVHGPNMTDITRGQSHTGGWWHSARGQVAGRGPFVAGAQWVPADSSERRNTEGMRRLRGTSWKIALRVAAGREAGTLRRVDRAGGNNSKACRIVGVHRMTGTRWRHGRKIRNTAGRTVHHPRSSMGPRLTPMPPRMAPPVDGSPTHRPQGPSPGARTGLRACNWQCRPAECRKRSTSAVCASGDTAPSTRSPAPSRRSSSPTVGRSG